MAKSTVIMHKAITDVDNSVQAKAMKFISKLIKDDALLGLHIEPINGSVDPKYRTGRVDDFWRAILFKLAGHDSNAYVFYGVVRHDDSIALAKKLRLDMNPINGIPEITRIADSTDAGEILADGAGAGGAAAGAGTGRADAGAADTGNDGVPPAGFEPARGAAGSDAGGGSGTESLRSAPPVPTAPSPGVPAPVAPASVAPAPVVPAPVPAPVAPVGEKLAYQWIERWSDDDLHEGLGLRSEYIAIARRAATVDDLLDGLEGAPEWQADALLDLATGTSLGDVKVKLGFVEDSDADALGEGAGGDGEAVGGAGTAGAGTGGGAGDGRGASGVVEADHGGTLDERVRATGASEAELVLAAMRKEAAQLSFAIVEGEDELEAALQDGDFQAWRVFLHPEQRRFAARDYRGPFRLSGGAGTGKTVVLVHRAVRLAKARPGARVVLTTFTRNLADELKTQVKVLDPKAPLAEKLGDSGIYVRGLDGLVSDVLRGASSEELSAAVGEVLGTPRTSVIDKPRYGTDRMWQEAVAIAGDGLPDRGDSVAFLQDEYEQVVLGKGITTQAGYLRVRRPGRGMRLSRQQRAAVWAVVEEYRARSAQQRVSSWEESRHIAAQILRARVEAAGEDVVGASAQERSAAYPADHVLVDEGQDLVAGHWRLLRALVRGGKAAAGAEVRNDLFIAEDSHQRIYGQKVKLSDFDIRITGRSRRLTLNYRTTEANLRFGLGVLESGFDSTNGVPEGGPGFTDLEEAGEKVAGYRSLRKGTAPVLRGFASEAEEMDFVAATVHGWLSGEHADPSLKPEQVAVLVRDRKSQDAVVRGLANADVDAQAVDGRGVVANGKPVVMTMHRAKGTEFRNVVLWGAGKDSIPAKLNQARYSEDVSADIDLRERSLLYVAATRARDQLIVTWHGEASAFVPQS